MKVIKTKVGHYGCGYGHKSEECLEIHCLGESYDGIYCLPCFCAAIVRRLAIPKVELVVPAPTPEPMQAEPEPEPAQTEPEEGAEGHPTETAPGAELTGDAQVEVPPPNEPEEGDEDDGREPGVPDESGGEPAAD